MVQLLWCHVGFQWLVTLVGPLVNHSLEPLHQILWQSAGFQSGIQVYEAFGMWLGLQTLELLLQQHCQALAQHVPGLDQGLCVLELFHPKPPHPWLASVQPQWHSCCFAETKRLWKHIVLEQHPKSSGNGANGKKLKLWLANKNKH